RPCETGLVLLTGNTARYAAVVVADLSIRRVFEQARRPRKPTAAGGTGLRVAGRDLVLVVLFVVRLQATGLHSAGHAVACPGSGGLPGYDPDLRTDARLSPGWILPPVCKICEPLDSTLLHCCRILS